MSNNNMSNINEWPMVSVIIPFYSNINWLIQALDSVIIQNYYPIEILVINDGSKEDLKKLDKYLEKIKIINKSNGGPASARNLGIEVSKGKYIAFLDSDDLWNPGKLHNQIYEMEKSNSVWSHHSYTLFWDNKEKTKNVDLSYLSGNILLDTFISFKVATDSIIILKSVITECNIKYNEEIRFGEDLDLYRQIGMKFPLLYVKGFYARVRIRGDNASLNPKIQLLDRAECYKRLNYYANIKLPLLTNFGLFLCYKSSKIIKLVNKDWLTRILSIIFYIIPFIFFKTNFYLRKILKKINYK